MSKKKNNTQPNPYHVDKFATIPAWLKIEFLKFWLAGASFYLMFFGLPQPFDYLDRLVMMILLLTIAVEYLLQLIIVWMNTDKQPTSFYLIHEIKRKSVLSLLATFSYVIIIVGLFHLALNLWLTLGLRTIGDLISESTLDPFSFAIFYMVIDTAWMYIRKAIKQRKMIDMEASTHETHL